MKRKRIEKIACFILVGIFFAFLLAGCSNSEAVDACLKGHKFGFWGGLLHGVIAPINLIMMFFRDDISVYATNNNGIWYAFGFVLGSGGWGFFGGNRVCRKK